MPRASFLIVLALAVVLTTAIPSPVRAQPAAAPDPGALTGYWWMFFVSGDNKTPLPEEEAKKMQAAHIANLQRLGKEGKGVMGGPFGDRTRLRGVVVLTVPTLEAVQAEFREDPFVKGVPIRSIAGARGEAVG